MTGAVLQVDTCNWIIAARCRNQRAWGLLLGTQLLLLELQGTAVPLAVLQWCCGTQIRQPLIGMCYGLLYTCVKSLDALM